MGFNEVLRNRERTDKKAKEGRLYIRSIEFDTVLDTLDTPIVSLTF
ncbi:hypothetical protein MUO14_19750 [Halobacillus shinanisalinarum]|uniref:Uncharacterized protein n=1 Tax=Halobacillus shinanisalinarum TaxID=2932258 RepID=A0ABY4GWT7_9BACI|nr:hypothetical protein [Halobacillus shinanisalinarum]UOQ92637.1 hypothetical protein MUO14_19750 [Halobacillus shinanisalinarum]